MINIKNNKAIVDRITSPSANVYELGAILNSCSLLLFSSSNFLVKFISRQANSAAHTLAREALSLTSPHIYHVVPLCIEPIISNEMKSFYFRKIKKQ